MSRRAASRASLVLIAGCLLAGPMAWSSAGGPLPRLAVSLPRGVLAAEAARALASSGVGDGMLVLPPVVVRVGTPGSAVEADALPGPALASPGADLFLHVVMEIGDVPGTGKEREAFVESRVSEVLERAALNAAPWKGLLLDVVGGAPSRDVTQFAVAALIVKARSVKPGIQVMLMLPADITSGPPDAARRLVAYADAIAVRADAIDWSSGRLAELAAGRPVMLKVPAAPGGGSATAVDAFLETMIAAGRLGADAFWIDVPSQGALREVAAAYRFLAQSMDAGFQVTASERAPASVLVDGRPARAGVGFVSSGTADVAFLLKADGSGSAPRVLSVTGGSDALQVACYDAAGGRRLAAGSDGKGSCVADAPYAFVRVSRGGGQERLYEAVDVRGRADLSVEEVIARWQASREAERRLLENYVATCLLNLHFESGTFGLGIDVALELEQYVDQRGLNDWIQTGLLVNGVRLNGVREFPLPQLEPDRVVAKPLNLSIDQKYRYSLAGTDTVNDRLCYVVDVEPADAAELLYSGRIWIDGLTFRHVRMRLQQRTGVNNVAAHVEIQDFATVRDEAGHEFTAFTKIYASETLNLGGRPVMLERTYHFDNYALNTAAFTSRLEAARKADNPMFRDTDGGLRALRKEDGELVVDPAPSKRIRSLVGGLIVDGSLPFPVPLAGVSWVDFDYRQTGSHMSFVFAGAFAAANLSRQRNPKLRTSVEFSLSALPTTLRTYEGDEELAGQQVRMFEQTAGAIVNYQPSAALTLSASSHLALHPFMRTDDTDPGYVTPSFGMNLRAWGEIRYARRSFEAVGLVEPVWRVAGWTPYGDEAEGLQTPARGYVKYDAELSQHLYVGKLSRAGISAAYYGGANLDRFSRYQSSFLVKPRIIGIPPGVDSFDAIGLAGGYYGFNVLDFIKLEASYNHAWARNLDESTRFRQFDGIDLDIGTAGPWGTYVQAAVGFALRGNLDRYDSRWGAQIMIFKPMRR